MRGGHIIILFIIVIVVLISIFIFLKWDSWHTPGINLTLSNSMVTFPGCDVTIEPDDLITMTDNELTNYASLVYFIDRFHMTQEETQYLGKRLLPRFFQQQQPAKETHHD